MYMYTNKHCLYIYIRIYIYTTYSYSQKPNVDTRFQFTTGPQVAKIRVIKISGTRSLIFPLITYKGRLQCF